MKRIKDALISISSPVRNTLPIRLIIGFCRKLTEYIKKTRDLGTGSRQNHQKYPLPPLKISSLSLQIKKSSAMEERTHVVVLPSPGMGHVIPMVEFAKLLALRHGFRVTCIVPLTSPPSKAMESIFEALPTGIEHVFLPPPSLGDLEGKPPGLQLTLPVTRSLSPLPDVLKSLMVSNPVSALVADLFVGQGLEVAKELNISPYVFFPSNAASLAVFLHLPKLDETVSCEYRDLTEPLEIPGCLPIHGKDLPHPLQDRQSEIYKYFLQIPRWVRFAEGIVLNTSVDLEGRAIRALEKEEAGNPPIYPIGPITNTSSSANHLDGSECLRWLDDQPSDSVLFIAFGSGGTLSYDQLNELALGLELCGQKFLWVVRPPNNESANAAHLKDQNNNNNPLAFLPEGFAERTKGQGLLVPSWAPQLQVLSHRSTSGFLTHCGWNSILEGIVHGVPLIAWPLYAEQRMNAVFLVEDLKVALQPKANTEGLVDREEIASVINHLMAGEEGKEVNSRMKALKIVVEKALNADGSSTRALSEFALKLASKTQ